MSLDPDSHWSATSNLLTIGPVPATFVAPVPILPFYHPWWFVLLSITWMALTWWLNTKGLGIGGLKLLIRRWLQGDSLHDYR